MTAEDLEKIEKTIKNKNDIERCRYYYNRIENGKNSLINEALEFAISKYKDIKKSDPEIIALKNLLIGNTEEQSLRATTLKKLTELEAILISKQAKDTIGKK